MRVLIFVTAIVGLAVAMPNPDDYNGPRTICPSSMTNCNCTTMTRGVLVACRNFNDRSQLMSTMHDLRGYNLQQFTMINFSLVIENGDFAEVNLFNMDVESSVLKVRSVHEGFLVETDNTLRALKFQNSILDFGETIAEHTKLSTLWFDRCMFNHYREEWFEGLSVDWLRIENCNHMTQFVASRLGELRKYSHVRSGLTKLQREMLPADSGSIEELDFSCNNITTLADDFLDGVTSLTKLDLSNNKLETLNETTFKTFNQTLVLSNNPLKCNSNLLWLAKRLEARTIQQPQRLTCFTEDGRRQSIRDLARQAPGKYWSDDETSTD